MISFKSKRREWQLFCGFVRCSLLSAYAKANGLVPYGYLKFIIEQLQRAESVKQVEALLPWNIKNEALTAWDKFS